MKKNYQFKHRFSRGQIQTTSHLYHAPCPFILLIRPHYSPFLCRTWQHSVQSDILLKRIRYFFNSTLCYGLQTNSTLRRCPLKAPTPIYPSFMTYAWTYLSIFLFFYNTTEIHSFPAYLSKRKNIFLSYDTKHGTINT